MTNEERIKKAISEFKDSCLDLHAKLEKFLVADRHLSIREKVEIDDAATEDVRTILHELTYSEYIFSSFYQRHFNVPNDKKYLDAYTNKVISRYEEDAENEEMNSRTKMEDMDEEHNDEYESEGDGFCSYCHERPCACSDRDN